MITKERMKEFCVECGMLESETPIFIDNVLIPCERAMKTVWNELVDK